MCGCGRVEGGWHDGGGGSVGVWAWQGGVVGVQA